MTDEDQLELRQRAIRELCQGEGISPERVAELPEEARRAFGSDDPARVRDLIVFAASTLPFTDHAMAIRNALGLYQHGGPMRDRQNLTVRRARFLEDKDLTYRTLVRHEDEGAALLARQVDIAAGLIPPEIVRSRLDLRTFGNDDREALERRIGDLEGMVTLLLDTYVAASPTAHNFRLIEQMKRVVGRGVIASSITFEIAEKLADQDANPE